MESDPESVTGEHLLSSYVVRIAIRRGRWRISLQDLRSGKISHFGSFAHLLEHLEALEPHLILPDWIKPEPE